MSNLPFVSVIVPVKNRPDATRKLIISFLSQSYPASRRELIVVGDVGDQTWSGIADYIAERSVRIIETDVRSDGRDANAKRNVGLEHARGEVLVLTDSDIVLPTDWISTGVRLMSESGHPVVAGGMINVGEGNFLSDYIDLNPVGSKTPRMESSYVLTSDNAGKGRYKQPITANLFFTREVYEKVGGLDADFVTPYEDYPYADVVLWSGYTILCTQELDAYHSHRDDVRGLFTEYWRAGIGCADYVMRYGESHLAKARVRQLALVSVAIPAWIVCLVLFPLQTVLITSVFVGIVSVAIAWQLRKPSAVWYLNITVLLSSLFSAGMIFGFIQRKIQAQEPTNILHVEELSYSGS